MHVSVILTVYCAISSVPPNFWIIGPVLQRFPQRPQRVYYHNIKGLLHFVQKEYKQAEKEFNYALQINRRFNNSKAIAANLNNLGMLPEHFQEKIKFLEEALQINLGCQRHLGDCRKLQQFRTTTSICRKIQKSIGLSRKSPGKSQNHQRPGNSDGQFELLCPDIP